MSYEKQTWESGDVVTSSKLNHMEDGIEGAGGGMVITCTESSGYYVMDKTYNEIKAQLRAGGIVTCPHEAQEDGMGAYLVAYIRQCMEGDGMYGAEVDWADNPFVTDSADGYPASRIDA